MKRTWIEWRVVRPNGSLVERAFSTRQAAEDWNWLDGDATYRVVRVRVTVFAERKVVQR